jgi:hypothetical protein
MLVSIFAIMTLQYVVIRDCCFDRGLVVLFLLPFDFLIEQSYCSELVVVKFNTVFWSGFLYFMGFSTFRVSTSGFVMCQLVDLKGIECEDVD